MLKKLFISWLRKAIERNKAGCVDRLVRQVNMTQEEAQAAYDCVALYILEKAI